MLHRQVVASQQTTLLLKWISPPRIAEPSTTVRNSDLMRIARALFYCLCEVNINYLVRSLIRPRFLRYRVLKYGCFADINYFDMDGSFAAANQNANFLAVSNDQTLRLAETCFTDKILCSMICLHCQYAYHILV